MSCCQSDDSSENLLKGLVAIETKDYYDAISYLTLSINQKPNSDAYYNRALVFSYLGDSCKFCDDLKQAVNMSNEEDSLEIDFFEFNVYNNNTLLVFKQQFYPIPTVL
jgi:tetratricopeptide (TPR) repeat protein